MESFYDNLSLEEKCVFNLYKSNDNHFCYDLNDTLRRKEPTTEFNSAIAILDSMALKYQSESCLILHRATTEALILPFLKEREYINPDFLSTALDLPSIQKHFTHAHPVYLRIECPIGMDMIPMEGNSHFGSFEKEMVIGRNNTFSLIDNRVESSRSEIELIMGRFYSQGINRIRIISVIKPS